MARVGRHDGRHDRHQPVVILSKSRHDCNSDFFGAAKNFPLLHKLALCYRRAMPDELKGQFSLIRAALSTLRRKKTNACQP